jgi:hypothetical protein
MEFVAQKHKRGCVVATLAMVTGRTYAEVLPDMDPSFKRGGIADNDLVNYLLVNGYAVELRVEGEGPLEPWAEKHVAIVRIEGTGERHCVAVEGDGTVLDPESGERRLSDYQKVERMWAVRPWEEGVPLRFSEFDFVRTVRTSNDSVSRADGRDCCYL